MNKNIYKIIIRVQDENIKYLYVKAEDIERAIEYAHEEYPTGRIEEVSLQANATIL